MRLLLIHSDSVSYEVTKDIKGYAEEIDDSLRKASMEEVLMVFCSVEHFDEAAPGWVCENVAAEISGVATQVKTDRIMLYPYAHLSSELTKDPKFAIGLLGDIQAALVREGFEVKRSPFGWYKAFKLSCKGHPLSELSREIRPTLKDGEPEVKEELSDALRAEETGRSMWHVLTPDGTLHPITNDNGDLGGFDFRGQEGLRKFAMYEISGSRVEKQEPPHIGYMQKLEIADYEPGSDPGNLRFYPKGRLIKSLLETFVTETVVEYGAMEVETPIMYDFEHPSLRSYLNRFPARQYTIQTPDKKVFLRFAACFGQFLMAHDATISYKQLPVRLYELTRYSFRVEQRGELAGLRRLRAFTMPDCHAFCGGMEQAKEEMMVRFDLSRRILRRTGLSVPDGLEFAIRVTREFYENNTEFVVNMVKEYGRPALVEMWNDRFFYFALKYEWNFVDALGKASALNTDQIDVENAERYGITYADTDGNKQFPYILHLSPSGAIERNIYALLEKAYLDSKLGKTPSLPYWLSPTQVRLVPVNDGMTGLCVELADQLPGVRVDIDDADSSIGKKVRRAEKEWIPYIIVVGEKEKGSGSFHVRVRGTRDPLVVTFEELRARLAEAQSDMPFKPLPLPRMLSKRIIFRG